MTLYGPIWSIYWSILFHQEVPRRPQKEGLLRGGRCGTAPLIHVVAPDDHSPGISQLPISRSTSFASNWKSLEQDNNKIPRTTIYVLASTQSSTPLRRVSTSRLVSPGPRAARPTPRRDPTAAAALGGGRSPRPRAWSRRGVQRSGP